MVFPFGRQEFHLLLDQRLQSCYYVPSQLLNFEIESRALAEQYYLKL